MSEKRYTVVLISYRSESGEEIRGWSVRDNEASTGSHWTLAAGAYDTVEDAQAVADSLNRGE